MLTMLFMVRFLVDVAPPVCGCGRRHWGNDGEGDGQGPHEYGKAA